MRIEAPAKLNLFLEVLAQEVSGYHQLETLFCALDLADELELERTAAGISLEVEGAKLGGVEENLVYRAALAYQAARGEPTGVSIRLRKLIPAAAGLGGGSSDAAATLRALDRMSDRPLGAARLLEIGAALGSDVPFFLCGAPLALAWGRGGRLLPLEALPSADVLLVVPARGVPTADAFAALARERHAERASPPRILRSDRLCDWEDVARIAHNDFEPYVFGQLPELGAAKQQLLRQGATMALLTGSGAAVYGVFRDASRRSEAEAAIAAQHPGLRLMRTRTAAPPRPLPFG